MIEEAWIQINSQNGHILNQGCFTAYYGCQSLGIKTRFFKNAMEYFLGIQQPGVSNNHLCVGGIDTLRQIFDLRGVQQPEVHSPHIHLPSYLRRVVTETTLGEVRALKPKFPCFIKPLVADKTFTGYVVRSVPDLIRLRALPDNFQLLISEVVKFVSEWRVFINRHAIVNVKNYIGDYSKTPKFEIFEYAINDYSEQKAAYSLDFGVTDKGDTMLIEINDAFGIAPYGLEPVAYLKFLMERWEEICNTLSFCEE